MEEETRDEMLTTDETPAVAVESAPPAEPTSRELAELEAYNRHAEALRIELLEIREKYGVESGEIQPDPLKEIRAEMEQMRNGFAEVKSMFEELRNAGNASPQIQQQPQQAYFYPQAQQPPIMPYYQTPNIMPIVPAVPTFNIK